MKVLPISPNSRLTIVVLGYVIRGPLGGMVWSNLHFLAGLARLGHDVYFLEDSDDYPSCYDPIRNIHDCNPQYGLSFAERTFRNAGLGERWSYYDAHCRKWHGPCADTMLSVLQRSHIVLNLCGVNPLRPWTLDVPIRVLVDEDPAFTQVRHLTDPDALARAKQHTHFFTFAQNIQSERCSVPNDGLSWQPTRQPVVLERLKPDASHDDSGRFTTIMQWQSYLPCKYNGIYLGVKSDSFLSFLHLPSRVGNQFRLAIAGAAPSQTLVENGWDFVDGHSITFEVESYEEFIRQSKAEFAVAKHAYAVTHSGWFSERSVAYLALGRPVVLQDTGFSDWMTTGAGVLPFRSVDEAVEAINEVNSRYVHHCRAARELAEAYFDSDAVLQRLIDKVEEGACVRQ